MTLSSRWKCLEDWIGWSSSLDEALQGPSSKKDIKCRSSMPLLLRNVYVREKLKLRNVLYHLIQGSGRPALCLSSHVSKVSEVHRHTLKSVPIIHAHMFRHRLKHTSWSRQMHAHVYTNTPSSATLVVSLKLLQWLRVSMEASSSLKGCTVACCPPGKWTHTQFSEYRIKFSPSALKCNNSVWSLCEPIM